MKFDLQPTRALYGERNGSSRFVPADIHAIRVLLRVGLSPTLLGRVYGVTQQAISNIKIKRSWGHLADEVYEEFR